MDDRRGNPVGTRSHDALDHAEQALWRIVSFFDTPLADIDAALAQDPAWAFAHVMRAGFLLTLTEPGVLPAVNAALARAEALASTATERERAHLAAVRRGAEGDWPGACAGWQAILDQHPRDLYALQWAHLFDFHRGDAAPLHARVERVLPAWPKDDPLRPYLLGMQAFGLEESGRLTEAEAVGREAVDGPGRVPWATHAVAHVMETQGRFEDGRGWLAARQADWSEGNGFAGHHWWHRGLFDLEAMASAAALALFDQRLAVAEDAITLQRLDAASLLWRLQLVGVDVGDRWQVVAHGWNLGGAQAAQSAFNDLHGLMALLGLGRHAEAEAFVDAARAHVDANPRPNARATREIGLPLMRGLLAFAREDWDGAIQHIAPLRATLHRIGGSHAQRDVVDQTLLAAASHRPSSAIGRTLLDERRRWKARTPLTAHWAARLG